MPVWLLVQAGDGKYSEIEEDVRKAIFDARAQLPSTGSVGVLVESPGGSAKSAYQIATIFKRQCNGFTAIVPNEAKSAATLLVLGADTLILNKYAELGPLDAQVWDAERDEYSSALNEVQALERLHAFALEAFDRTMFLLLPRTRKKVDTLLPHVLEFISHMMRPMLESVDVVHYTQRARQLKVAEEYAARLLRPHYGTIDEAKEIARHLVEKYPEHDFVVDSEELPTIGIKNTKQPTAEQIEIMDIMLPYLGETMIGRVEGGPP
jgi:hypothetical protein